jgi:hypothetical protein
MPGQLQLSGGAAGLLAGSIITGPLSVSGKTEVPGEIIGITLEANVDFVVKVPPEATAYYIAFKFVATSPIEVKVRTNLNNADGGLPIPATGFFAALIVSGTTEIKIKAASAPSRFNFGFI